MAKGKKRHHFVPAAHLRRFADARGMLAISRKDTPETVTFSRPEEAAFRRFYYAQPLPDGSMDTDALEICFRRWKLSGRPSPRCWDRGSLPIR
ncbi:DUF4238 domain-containing protein [Sphingomonas gellani]|uniref:DUF4238 domain-containing protein n=1 Tax=Sphingomonas gellani TaxID=1166340 RepID=UPI0011133BB0|nr:DUF4238 domain-containing protein [Sphingomonas gellani]